MSDFYFKLNPDKMASPKIILFRVLVSDPDKLSMSDYEPEDVESAIDDVNYYLSRPEKFIGAWCTYKKDGKFVVHGTPVLRLLKPTHTP